VQNVNIDRSDNKFIAEVNKYNAIDSGIWLFVAFIINASVLIVFAAAFFKQECAQVEDGPLANVDETCQSIGLADSGKALENAFGLVGKHVWAIGLLSAGQASTMTGMLSGQIVLNGFFDLKVALWKRILIARSVALIPATIVALATASSSTVADSAGEFLNVLQSVQLPFALIPVLRFTSNADIMGDEFVNGSWRAWIGRTLATLALVANFALVLQGVLEMPEKSAPIIILIVFFVCLYSTFLGYISFVSLRGAAVEGKAVAIEELDDVEQTTSVEFVCRVDNTAQGNLEDSLLEHINNDQ